MIEKVDCIVIGAGVVGLAVARACAQQGLETLVLDRAEGIGTETSARNSEVIHAGIYYPQHSLKGSLCVQGKQALYEYCQERGIEAQRCGKLIVATDPEQLPALRDLMQHAHNNGVDDLQWLDAAQAQALEPELQCIAALHSPSTGIVDSHALMVSLQADLEAAGGMVVCHAPVLSARIIDNGQKGIVVQVGGDEPMALHAQYVINCAGLYAIELAHTFAGLAPHTIPTGQYAKGNYFSLSGKAPFSQLIYPLPTEGGLGIHLALDLGGQARFGPDVEWVDSIDYAVNPERVQYFYEAIRQYWPGLPDNALQPDYAGIRPKLAAPTGQVADFMIQGEADHGIHGLVNLYGIESPGLTAALAIGAYAVGQLTPATPH